MATQKFDLAGNLFSPSGYVAGDGTSFAAPLVGGAAALVKQARPTMTPAEIRSALINSTAQDVTTDDFGAPVDTQWIGAGRLDAAAALAGEHFLRRAESRRIAPAAGHADHQESQRRCDDPHRDCDAGEGGCRHYGWCG